MPLTQNEMATMRTMIVEAVRSEITLVVQPLQDDIDVLKREARSREEDARKNSGAYKDLAKDANRISQNDLRQEAAIASLVVDVAATKADVAAVKANQESAAIERTTTAAAVTNTASDVTIIKNTMTSYFAQRPNVVIGILGALVGMVLAAILAATAWLQGVGKH